MNLRSIFIMNMVLNRMEMLLIVYMMFDLMLHVNRTIYKKNEYTFIAFLLTASAGYASAYISPSLFYITIPVACVVFSIWLFNKNVISLLNLGILYITIMMMTRVVVYCISLWWDITGSPFVSFFSSANFLLIAKLVVLVVCQKVLILIFKRKVPQKISKSQNLTVTCLMVVNLLFLVTSFNNQSAYFLMIINALLLMILNFYSLYVLYMHGQQYALDENIRLYEKQSQLQYQHYLRLEEKYQSSRKMLHDMRNHLLAIEQLYHINEDEAANGYAMEIHQMINKMGQKSYCEHHLLDIILNEKLIEAEGKGIETKVLIGDADLTWLRDIDITTIFANLLDNALHAASQTKPDSSIIIKISQHQDFIVIVISNTATAKDEQSDRRSTGLGLVNVRNALKQYDGTLTTEHEGNIFRATVTIPSVKE